MHSRIILAIAKKDIVDAVKNAYVLFALILPVGLSLLFSFMSASGGKDRLLNIVIYDAGQSRLVEQLQANRAVKLIPANSADEVPVQVKDGQLGGLALPADFDAAVAAGKTPELRVYYNGRRSIGEQTALRQTMEDALRASAGQTLPARLVPFDVASSGKGGAGQEVDLAKFYLVMSLVLALCMAGVFVVPTILVEEKEKHTLQAILVSPAGYLDLVIGKALVGMFYSLLLALLLLLLNKGFAGNAVVTILAVVLGSLFLVQVGLLMGAVFGTTTQVNTWSSIIMMALFIPAIFAMPPQPPAPVSTIMRLIPTSYMADAIIIGLSDRASLSNVGLDLLVLAVATVIVSAAVIWALRRERV
jgi:ABC-2 type transport system permease protein